MLVGGGKVVLSSEEIWAMKAFTGSESSVESCGLDMVDCEMKLARL